MTQELSLLMLQGSAYYFLAINLVYGILMLFSWMKIKRYRKRLDDQKTMKELPAVSFLIPAYNEESLIVETIQTYLSLPQEKKEIIVIDDGSHDKTMTLLKTMFQLKRVNDRFYKSITHPELKVLEASHMGKAQALNYGVQHASYEIICTMDADTIPMARGVEACLRSFATDKKLVAAGGVIQVLSTQVLKENSPLTTRAKEWLTSFQRIEYLRTFICERLGWSYLGATVLISGAFCMIKKEAIKRVGGFNARSITEDLDLIVRLRREYQGERHHFHILPVTTCYTQVPRRTRHLKIQRIRWQLGLVQTMFQNLTMLFNPSHGLLGMFAIPYFWLVEIFSPIVEAVAIVLIPYAIFMNWINPEIVLTYLGVGLLFNLGITLMGVYLDNRYISKNKSWAFISSTILTTLMHFGYKQLNSWWRIIALVKSFKRTQDWGEKPREEIIHKAS